MDLKEFSMEHPRKLRTFADDISPVGVSAAFFSMSDSSQKLSTAPWHRDEECLSTLRQVQENRTNLAL